MKRRSILWLILVSFLAGCVTNKFADRDRANPSYEQGAGIPIADDFSVGQLPKSGNIQPVYTGKDGPTALVEAAISLAAYPDYYKPSSISGTCVIGENSFAQVPCRHIEIALINRAGGNVGRTMTNDTGAFAFYVKKGERYRLRVSDPRFVMTNEAKDLAMGETVNVQLTKR